MAPWAACCQGFRVDNCASESSASVLSLPVRVLTRKLEVVPNLPVGDFQLWINETPQPICGFRRERVPSTIGILLDVSASMGDNIIGPRLASALFSEILTGSEPGDEYFVEYVSENPSMACGLGCEQGRIRELLKYKAHGRTSMVDGIYLALNEMRKARHDNRALIVFSDAQDNASVYQSRELEAEMDTLPIPLYLVVPRRPQQPIQGHLVGGGNVPPPGDFVKWANRSGGIVTVVDSVSQAATAGIVVSKALRAPYVISFVAPHDAPPSSVHRVRLEVSGVTPKPLLFFRGILVHKE